MHLAMTQGAPQGAFALGQRVAQLGVLSAHFRLQLLIYLMVHGWKEIVGIDFCLFQLLGKAVPFGFASFILEIDDDDVLQRVAIEGPWEFVQSNFLLRNSMQKAGRCIELRR